MVRFWYWEITKEKIYAEKIPIKILCVNVDNIFISKLVKTKINSKYWIWYLCNAIRSLILEMLKMRVDMLRHLNLKKEDKDKNNKLMSFGIDDE